MYKLKLDQKLRRSNSSVYITIKVKDDQTEVLEDEKVLSSDEVDDNIVSSGKKDTVVKDVTDEENPGTGDFSVFRYVGGGFVSLVGIFGLNRRKRKELIYKCN